MKTRLGFVGLFLGFAFGCSASGSGQPAGSGGSVGAGSGGSASGSGGASGTGGSVGSGGSSGSGGTVGGTGGASSGGATGSGGATPPDGSAGGADGGPVDREGGNDSGPAGGCPAGVHGHCSMASYPTYPGFMLALVEDFDAPLDIDADPVWTWSDGALDEGQVRMTKGAITFGNGRMRLTVSRQATGGGMSYSEDKNVNAQPLSSGELRTKYNNFRYGRYEVRFKPPTSRGNFISTMFTFRTPKTIFWRELDVELTASSVSQVGSNIVWGNNQTGYGGTMNAYQAINGPGGYDNQADFHVYAIEWLPTKVTWFLDGQMIRTAQAGGGPTIPERSAKIMMNLWIFGSNYAFGGSNNPPNQYPLFAEYDWFRFYKSDMENTYPCWDVPTCLPHADLIRSKNNPNDGVTLVPN
ncbi:MAG TPA: glycoside hydrolase family 16 protein [Polyangia bacterium]|nr:glycoside hydrolase family 16 protein [Polyangia bacterium]